MSIVSTRDGFVAASAPSRRVRSYRGLPVVRIETHGNDEGIGIPADNGFMVT